jgi:hypothetical protein
MADAVQLWTTALSQLQQLPTVPQAVGSHDQAPLDIPLPAASVFNGLPRVSSTVWKQLVNDLQVIPFTH